MRRKVEPGLRANVRKRRWRTLKVAKKRAVTMKTARLFSLWVILVFGQSGCSVVQLQKSETASDESKSSVESGADHWRRRYSMDREDRLFDQWSGRLSDTK